MEGRRGRWQKCWWPLKDHKGHRITGAGNSKLKERERKRAGRRRMEGAGEGEEVGGGHWRAIKALGRQDLPPCPPSNRNKGDHPISITTFFLYFDPQ